MDEQERKYILAKVLTYTKDVCEETRKRKRRKERGRRRGRRRGRKWRRGNQLWIADSLITEFLPCLFSVFPKSIARVVGRRSKVEKFFSPCERRARSRSNLICKQSTPWKNCSTRGDPGHRGERWDTGGRERSGNDDVASGEDPVLKNADEAEVKESCTRRKSQADLSSSSSSSSSSGQRLPSFLVVQLAPPSFYPLPSNSRRYIRDLDVLTLHSNLELALFVGRLFFISTLDTIFIKHLDD